MSFTMRDTHQDIDFMIFSEINNVSHIELSAAYNPQTLTVTKIIVKNCYFGIDRYRFGDFLDEARAESVLSTDEI